ncbi:hypothetical protein C0585_00510 [Candidatus Woesearchaeota archaeon]|nr:MAG: hypothetical protein C0585_00510 [Candidatus Woesearchaeota archaeon]
MIIWLFGILDILAGIVIVLLNHNLAPWNIGLGFSIYLFIKSFMFKGDLMSFIDFFIGIYIILLLFGFHSWISYLFAIFLIQKGAFSLK